LFFWAAHRSAAFACPAEYLFFNKIILHPEEALLYSALGGGRLSDGFRVRAARRRGKSKTIRFGSIIFLQKIMAACMFL